MDHDAILSRLCGLGAPSGFEGPASRAAAELLRPLADEVTVDRMGSVLALRRCGREGAKRLLLDAHLDEIGFVVTGHEEGYLKFAPLGGVDPRMLPDRELTVLTDPPLAGVVACLPPHVQTREDMDKSIPIRELCLDVGLSQEEAERRVPVGTPAVFRGGCFPLGQELICGKSLDDRACFAALLGALELLKDRPKPLALYLFSRNKGHIRAVTERCSFGGGCVNDVVIHLATSAMGFGGVGESGMGAYHGRVGFETFSHRKSIVEKKTWMDLPMRYQPYLPLHEKLIRRFLR